MEAYAADFFIPGRCGWLKRQAAKGRPISEEWALSKRGLLVNHVFPALGKVRMDRLNRPMIERFLVDLDRSCQTRNHLLYALRTVLGEAEAEGVIARNPLEHAEPLGRKARKRDVFSLPELKRLFPDTPGGLLKIWGEAKYAALYLTLATTGIREGEVRALAWKHVLPNGWLVIERAVKEGGAIGATKSGTSRVAVIPFTTQKVLSWWQKKSQHTGSEDLVFHGEMADRPLNRRTFPDVFGRALAAAIIETGGRFLTTHSLRHTYNTLMNRTIPADTLRALMGHRDERMTSHYDHPTPRDLVKALEVSRATIENATRW